MKKLSKLSQECIKNKGLCCEKRTPHFLFPEETALFLKKGYPKNKLSQTGSCNMVKGLCHFFNRPLCSIYQNRPVDCRTYPVSIDIKNGKIVYVIDRKCPAVQKEIVTKSFINSAIRLWQKSSPSLEWIKNYQRDDSPQTYDWMPVETYVENLKK